MPVIEYILIGLVCFALGTNIGNSKHRYVRQPDKQIIIDDSTKVVNIYVDNYGQYWGNSAFTMGWDPYWRFGFYGPRIVVFHKGGKKYTKWVYPKKWRGHNGRSKNRNPKWRG